ncbi:ubiquitin protein ligase, putative [Entamoeba dispar SAW760]|uniref:HECT-type E3 ubiquitin transferase n=1 Tax=Entamoeba dispar (strain ATCC PRA-260 / SAW760) TaxID=370354 RepID=B0EQG1_ENTDS|nr:ubiquitin protein ligase, putative [Entamoeba dispar SAW760]EDR23216.1 ubiquitin protein ligase, putative [Entamoeba dispar SAW760]|eukprot:EDR23216.1 ubiquitin protein ligase, putative [Entamoeba dispar SAW760]
MKEVKKKNEENNETSLWRFSSLVSISECSIPKEDSFKKCLDSINSYLTKQINTHLIGHFVVCEIDKKERNNVNECLLYLKNIGHLFYIKLLPKAKQLCYCQYPEIVSSIISMFPDCMVLNDIDENGCSEVNDGETYLEYIKRVYCSMYNKSSLLGAQLKYMKYSNENCEHLLHVIQAAKDLSNIELLQEMMKDEQYRDDSLQLISNNFSNDLIVSMLVDVTKYYLNLSLKQQFNKELIFFIHCCLSHLLDRNPPCLVELSLFLYQCDQINIHLRNDIVSLSLFNSSSDEIIEQIKHIIDISEPVKIDLQVTLIDKLLRMNNFKPTDSEYVISVLKSNLSKRSFCIKFIPIIFQFKFKTGMNTLFRSQFDELVQIINDIIDQTHDNAVITCLFILFDCIVQYTELFDADQVKPTFSKLVKYMKQHFCLAFIKIMINEYRNRSLFTYSFNTYLQDMVDSIKSDLSINFIKFDYKYKQKEPFNNEIDFEEINDPIKRDGYKWFAIQKVINKKQTSRNSNYRICFDSILKKYIPIQCIPNFIHRYNKYFNFNNLEITVQITQEELKERKEYSLDSLCQILLYFNLIYANSSKRNQNNFIEKEKIIKILEITFDLINYVACNNTNIITRVFTNFIDKETDNTLQKINCIIDLMIETIGGFPEDMFIKEFIKKKTIRNGLLYLLFFLRQKESPRRKRDREFYYKHQRKIVSLLWNKIPPLKNNKDKLIYHYILKSIPSFIEHFNCDNIFKQTIINFLLPEVSSFKIILQLFSQGIFVSLNKIDSFLGHPLINHTQKEIKDILIQELEKSCSVKRKLLPIVGYIYDDIDLTRFSENKHFTAKASFVKMFKGSDLIIKGCEETLISLIDRVSLIHIQLYRPMIELCNKDRLKEILLSKNTMELSLTTALMLCQIADFIQFPLQIHSIGTLNFQQDENENYDICLNSLDLVSMLIQCLVKRLDSTEYSEELNVVRLIMKFINSNTILLFRKYQQRILQIMLRNSLNKQDVLILYTIYRERYIDINTEEGCIIKMLFNRNNISALDMSDITHFGLYQNKENIHLFEEPEKQHSKPINKNNEIYNEYVYLTLKGKLVKMMNDADDILFYRLCQESFITKRTKGMLEGNGDIKWKEGCLNKIRKAIKIITDQTKNTSQEHDKVSNKEEKMEEESIEIKQLKEVILVLNINEEIEDIVNRFIRYSEKNKIDKMKEMKSLMIMYQEILKEQEMKDGCNTIIDFMNKFKGMDLEIGHQEDKNEEETEEENVQVINIPGLGTVPIPHGFDTETLMQLPEEYRIEAVMNYYQEHNIPRIRRSEDRRTVQLSHDIRKLPCEEFKQRKINKIEFNSNTFKKTWTNFGSKILPEFNIKKALNIYFVCTEDECKIILQKINSLFCNSQINFNVVYNNFIKYIVNDLFIEILHSKVDEKMIRYWQLVDNINQQKSSEISSEINEMIIDNLCMMIEANIKNSIILNAVVYLPQKLEMEEIKINEEKYILKLLSIFGRYYRNRPYTKQLLFESKTQILIDKCLKKNVQILYEKETSQEHLLDLYYMLLTLVPSTLIEQEEIESRTSPYFVRLVNQRPPLRNLEFGLLSPQLILNNREPIQLSGPFDELGINEIGQRIDPRYHIIREYNDESNNGSSEEQINEESIHQNNSEESQYDTTTTQPLNQIKELQTLLEDISKNNISPSLAQEKVNQLTQDILMEEEEEPQQVEKKEEKETEEEIVIIENYSCLLNYVKKCHNELVCRVVLLLLSYVIEERYDEIVKDIVMGMKWFIEKELRLNRFALNTSLIFLSKHREFLPFEMKYQDLIKEIGQNKNYNHFMKIIIDRNNVFNSLFKQIKQTEKWNRLFKIQFKHEQGNDNGGLLKECYSLLVQELSNGVEDLFVIENNCIVPNCQCFKKNHFIFVGKCLAKMISDGFTSDFHLALFVLRLLLSKKNELKDVKIFDKEMSQQIENLLLGDVTEWGLTFTEIERVNNKIHEVELKKNGAYILVTQENKKEYVDLLIQYKFNTRIEKQIEWVKKGFYSLINKSAIQLFDEKEFDRIICGNNFDIEDLKRNVVLEGYTKESLQIVWLWEVINEMENSLKGKFVQFVTGSSRAPIGGFVQLKSSHGTPLPFTIASIHYDSPDSMMPTAHTCANRLEIPFYSNKEILKLKLTTAIQECSNYEFD